MTTLSPYYAGGYLFQEGDNGEDGERPRADGEEAYNHGASLLGTTAFEVETAAQGVDASVLTWVARISGRYFQGDFYPAGWAGRAYVQWTSAGAFSPVPAGTEAVTLSGTISALDFHGDPGSYELLWGFAPHGDLSGFTYPDLTGYVPPNSTALSGGSFTVTLPTEATPEGYAVVFALSSPLLESPPPYPGGWTDESAISDGRFEQWGYWIDITALATGGQLIPTRIYPRADGIGMGAPRLFDNRSPYRSARVFGTI